MKKIVLLAFVLLLLSPSAINIQPAKAEELTIYIREDGSIDPPTAPIVSLDNVTYTFTGNIYRDIVVNRNNIIINGRGHTLQASTFYGFYLPYVNNVTIKNTTITNSDYGIWLGDSSSSNTVSGNNITTSSLYGIFLDASSNNSISGNNITATYDGAGIYLASSSSNNISGNKIAANNAYGIWLRYSPNNSVSGNNITNNSAGIFLESSNNSVSGNNITANNAYGIRLLGSNNSVSGNTFTNNSLDVWDSYMNSVDNNTVNGKPLVYLEGVADYTVGDAGQVILVSCNSIRVENLTLSRTTIGVKLLKTNNTIISGNNITANNLYGILLRFSSNNSMSGNNIANNGVGAGIWLDYSSNNSVSGNNITANNNDGIMLRWSSNNNSVSGNNITANNGDGIMLQQSSNNSVSGNNITANSNYGIDLDYSSNNNSTGNNIAANNAYGIRLGCSSGNSVSGNNIANNGDGILLTSSSDNSVSGNNITANRLYGIFLGSYSFPYPYFLGSDSNNISGNNIANNGYGIWLDRSSNNKFYQNNFTNNGVQVYSGSSTNVWDSGYPSGGNYWSDYNGTDSYSGAYQNETGSDGVGDTPYVIDPDNRDNYPLISLWTAPAHELIVTITAPTFMRIGDSISLEAIVTNEGLNDEASVKLELLINGTIVDSITIPTLKPYFPHTLSHLWTPSNEGICNVTAYVNPLSGETSIENNKATKIIIVGPPLKVGVKAGDWIKVEYTVNGWPAGQPYPERLKVEFLTVEGTTATVRVTMHMSDGTEQNATVAVDVVTGGQALGLSGFVIPANLTVGDIISMSGYVNVTIAGETTRNYAGASRKVVYASLSQYGTQLTYYWDKQTGIMVEASTTSGTMTVTGKATETNMWEAVSSPFWMQWWFYAIVAVVIVALAGAVYFIKKRKPPTPTAPPLPTEGT